MKKFFVSFGAAIIASFMLGGVASASGGIDLDRDGYLKITKYEGSTWENGEKPSDAKTLQGVEFTVCHLDEVNLGSSVGFSKVNELNEIIENSKKGELPEGTTCSNSLSVTTGDDGVAQFNSLPVGAYYVKETKAPSNVAEHVKPFLVTIPTRENSVWNYDVKVYPKNAIFDVEKTIKNPSGPVGVGGVVEWGINTEIPLTQGDLEYYALGDELDSRLSYVEGSTQLMLGEKTFPAELYNLSVKGNLIKIEFTAEGLSQINTLIREKASDKDRTFHWSLSTIVNSIGNGTIENKGVVWANDSKVEHKVSPEVSSNWGVARFVKFDEKTKDRLAGAMFQIFGNEEDANACAVIANSKDFSVEKGCQNAVEVDGEKFFTTDKDGVADIKGLSVGVDDDVSKEYWATEVAAPEGYILLVKPFKFSVTLSSEGSPSSDSVINVPNAATPGTPTPPGTPGEGEPGDKVPGSGGDGTATGSGAGINPTGISKSTFLVGFVIIVVGGLAGVYAVNAKRKEEEVK